MRRKNDISTLRYARSFERLQLRTSIFKLKKYINVCVFLFEYAAHFDFPFQAKPFEGQLPSSKNPPTHGQKLNQVFQRVLDELEHILEGYILPEPYFSVKLKTAVDSLMLCLKDPSLPMLELQVKYTMSS